MYRARLIHEPRLPSHECGRDFVVAERQRLLRTVPCGVDSRAPL